jgi:competence protein ComEC
MIRPHQAVTVVSLGWVVGILVASYFSLSPWSFVPTAILLLGLICFSSQPFAKLLALFTLGLIFGWWRHGLAIDSFPYPPLPLPTTPAIVEGRVVSHPEFVDNRQRFYLAITMVDDRPANFRSLVYGWHLPRLEHGMLVRATLDLQLPGHNEEFDYASFLAKDRVSTIAYPESEIEIIGSHVSLLGQLYRGRDILQRKLEYAVPGTAGALAGGLLLGTRSSLPDDFRDALKRSGTSHIVALSGANITIVTSFIILLFQFFTRRPRLILSGAAIILFVIMTGASSSVVRAAVMGCLLLLTGLWGRPSNALNILLLAIVIMTAINPAILQYDVGFQLSLAAVVGILWLAPILANKLLRLPRLLNDVLSQTIAASLLTLPLLVYNFAGVSFVGLLANLLVVPVVPIAMLTSFISLVAGLIIPPLATVTGLLAWPALHWIVWAVRWTANLPLAFTETAPLSPMLVPAAYIGISGFIYLLRNEISKAKISSLVRAWIMRR